MSYLAAAISDQGSKGNVNQDAILVKNRITSLGEVCIAVVCDGMGGLSKGEEASGHVIRRLNDWFTYHGGGIRRFDKMVYLAEKELHLISDEIMEYGRKNGFVIGTTTTLLLLAGRQFAIIHVGDSRAYKLQRGVTARVRQLTTDQSVNDCMLTQSVGCARIAPEIIRGKVERGDVFLLCSDGFRHKNTLSDLKKGFASSLIKDENQIEGMIRVYIDRARKLGETDDISALVLKVV